MEARWAAGLVLVAAAAGAGAHDAVVVDGGDCPGRVYVITGVPGPDHVRFRPVLLLSQDFKADYVHQAHDVLLQITYPSGVSTNIGIGHAADSAYYDDRFPEFPAGSSGVGTLKVTWNQINAGMLHPFSSEGYPHKWWKWAIDSAHPMTVVGYIVGNDGSSIANLSVKEYDIDDIRRPDGSPAYACTGHQ